MKSLVLVCVLVGVALGQEGLGYGPELGGPLVLPYPHNTYSYMPYMPKLLIPTQGLPTYTTRESKGNLMMEPTMIYSREPSNFRNGMQLTDSGINTYKTSNLS